MPKGGAPSDADRLEAPRTRGRALRCGAVLLAALLGAAGCSTVPRTDAVELRLTLDADSYDIGAPVLATVQVRNTADEGLMLPALDGSTLKFLSGQPGTGVRVRREPVLPEHAPGRPRTVAPGESEWRTFLFTRLTPEAGAWGLMAALSGCRIGSETGEPLPTCYSESVRYEVSESVRFERDPYSGILTREQAVALVRQAGGAAADADLRAVLVPVGESGLYVWTIFPQTAGGEVVRESGFMVNPYSGAVEPLEMSEPQQEGKEE